MIFRLVRNLLRRLQAKYECRSNYIRNYRRYCESLARHLPPPCSSLRRGEKELGNIISTRERGQKGFNRGRA